MEGLVGVPLRPLEGSGRPVERDGSVQGAWGHQQGGDSRSICTPLSWHRTDPSPFPHLFTQGRHRSTLTPESPSEKSYQGGHKTSTSVGKMAGQKPHSQNLFPRPTRTAVAMGEKVMVTKFEKL